MKGGSFYGVFAIGKNPVRRRFRCFDFGRFGAADLAGVFGLGALRGLGRRFHPVRRRASGGLLRQRFISAGFSI